MLSLSIAVWNSSAISKCDSRPCVLCGLYQQLTATDSSRLFYKRLKWSSRFTISLCLQCLYSVFRCNLDFKFRSSISDHHKKMLFVVWFFSSIQCFQTAAPRCLLFFSFFFFSFYDDTWRTLKSRAPGTPFLPIASRSNALGFLGADCRDCQTE